MGDIKDLREYGAWAKGHAIQTCGPHTGHFVRTIALCESAEIAEALAVAFNAPSKSEAKPQPTGALPQVEIINWETWKSNTFTGKRVNLCCSPIDVDAEMSMPNHLIASVALTDEGLECLLVDQHDNPSPDWQADLIAAIQCQILVGQS